MLKMQKILLAILFVLPLAAFCAPQEGKAINSVVAIVNDGVITQSDLDSALKQAEAQAHMAGVQLPSQRMFEQKVLNKLIVEKVALQLAHVNHLSVTDSEINKSIAGVARQNRVSVDKLKSMIVSQGISFDQYRRLLKNKLLIRKLEQGAVASSIVITQQDVDNFLKQVNIEGKNPTEYTISHILIGFGDNPTPASIKAADQKAQSVIAKIKAGMSFTKAAVKYSAAGDALTGGLLKDKSLSDLPTIFAQLVPTMKVGGIKGPLKSEGGYHIIKLISKVAPKGANHFVEEFHIKMIMVKTSPILSADKAKTLLLSLRNAIKNGASFASIAKTNSQDVASASRGGDMGWVTTDKLPQGLGSEVATMTLNQLSQPFSIGSSWYLVDVLGKRQKDNTKAYKEMMARRALFQQKAVKAVQAWQAKIRAESYVKVLLR